MNPSTAKAPFRISTSLVDFGMSAERSITRHEQRYLLLTVALFAILAAYRACTVPLWFDEFFTLFVSRLSSLPEMLRAMPADSQPPLQHLVTCMPLRLFGASEFVLRLPELLAYMTAGVLTYRIVRRHGTAVQALFAAALLLGADVARVQAYTARPYGLLIASVALVFASWQAAAARESGRLLPLCGVALGTAGAILSHHFAPIHIGMVLCVGETARLIQRRRVDGWMGAAIAAGLTPLFVTVPLARASHALFGVAILHANTFFIKPSPLALLSYVTMVPLLLLCMVAAFCFLPWRGEVNDTKNGGLFPVPVYEWAATCGLCLLVPVQILVAALLQRGFYFPRYAVSCNLGLAILCAWGLPRIWRLRRVAQPVLALSTIGYLLFIGVNLLLLELRRPAWRVEAGDVVSPLLLTAPDDLPIVVSNALDFPPTYWYAQPALQRRLIYLFDVPYALRQSDFIPELSLAADEEYIHMPMTGYSDFIASHPHFLLFYTGNASTNMVPPRLVKSGWHLSPIARAGNDVLYRVDRP
jgi:hypothetical protein